MKEAPQRKTVAFQPPQNGSTNRKLPEVSVIKHFHPNPTRDTMRSIPEVRFSELPEGSRYLHLHPVFKFVDSFLSSTSVNTQKSPSGSSNASAKKKSSGKITRKCECLPAKNVLHYVGGDSKTAVPQKAKMPVRVTNLQKQERIKTNINNINSKSNVRVSLRNQHQHGGFKREEAPTNLKQIDNIVEKISTSPTSGSDYYIEQLKEEIQKSKSQFLNSCLKNDDYYITKLKNEILCTKAKYLNDARNVINELQNEILNYRLQAKVKYSSSCSDIFSGDNKTVTPPLDLSSQKYFEPPLMRPQQIGDNLIMDGPLTPDEDRCNPCETLWHSKSFASSTDLEHPQPGPDINFEEKLEEANCLIEKVRKALRDIGKGINRQPEQKKPISDLDQPVKEVKYADEATCSKIYASKANDKSKKIKIEEKESKISKAQLRAQLEVASKVALACVDIEKDLPEEETETSPTVTIRKSDGGENETICSPEAVLGGDDPEFPVTPSMEKLQEKLRTISELSESDSTADKVKQERVTRIERGSSPINISSTYYLKSTDATVAEKSVSPEVLIPSVETRSTEKSILNKSENDKLKDSTGRPRRVSIELNSYSLDKSEKMSKASSERTNNLSIQVMPPVSIPRALTMQRTLNLCIKPTGSVHNDMPPKQSNIVYQEINVDCHRQCITEDTPYCCKGEITHYTPDNKDGIPLSADASPRSMHHQPKSISQQMLLRKEVAGQSANINPKTMDENAFILFKSFQILDDAADSRMSMCDVMHNVSRSADDTFVYKGRRINPNVKIAPSEKSYSTSHDSYLFSDSDDSPRVFQLTKSPWEIGFYKTKSTQCSDMYLGGSDVPAKTSSTDEPKTASSSLKSTESTSVYKLKRSPSTSRKTIEYPEGSSNVAKKESPESFQEPELVPVKDLDLPKSIQMAQVLRALNDSKEKDYLNKSLSSQTTDITEADKSFKTSALNHGFDSESIVDDNKILSAVALERKMTDRKIKRSISSSSSSSSNEKEVKKDTKKESSSTSSGSSSSSYVSIAVGVQNEARSPVVGSIEGSKAYDGSTINTHMSNTADIDVENQVSKDAKAEKVDENIQVSLEGSDDDSSSEGEDSENDRQDTIQDFIKGLTGTSQDEMNKLKSKTELSSWSKSMLETEETRERMLSSHVYDKPSDSRKDSQGSELSENTKLQRLREFQKRAQGATGGDDKIVMRLSEETGDAGEGRCIAVAKRHLPFYRKVFGKVTRPSEMYTSKSDATPVDESVSEGEIKCKSSASIGEIYPFKYLTETRKKLGLKALKRHPEGLRSEIDEKTLRIARQRTHYNSWVAHYLQKQQNLALNEDSASISPDSSVRK